MYFNYFEIRILLWSHAASIIVCLYLVLFNILTTINVCCVYMCIVCVRVCWLCVCVCCMCVYAHVCVCAYVCVYIYVCAYVCVYLCVRFMFACVLVVCTCVCVRMLCMCTWCVCTYVCMCACKNIATYVMIIELLCLCKLCTCRKLMITRQRILVHSMLQQMLPKPPVSLMLPYRHGEYKSLYLIEHTSCCCIVMCDIHDINTYHDIIARDII